MVDPSVIAYSQFTKLLKLVCQAIAHEIFNKRPKLFKSAYFRARRPKDSRIKYFNLLYFFFTRNDPSTSPNVLHVQGHLNQVFILLFHINIDTIKMVEQVNQGNENL